MMFVSLELTLQVISFFLSNKNVVLEEVTSFIMNIYRKSIRFMVKYWYHLNMEHYLINYYM